MLFINCLQMATQSKQVMLVVGEASGDVHGAQFVRALIDKDHTLRFFGVGGEQLQQTNFEALFNVSQLASMGLLELAGSVREHLAGLSNLEPSHAGAKTQPASVD